MTQNVPTVRVRDLTRAYHLGDEVVHALAGISLDVWPGEFVAIMGASGSGKSTLMNMLGCLDRPTSGAYELDGIDVATMPDDELSMVRNQKIGFVFQSYNLLPRIRAVDQVAMPLIYSGAPDRETRALAALERVGLGERVHHRPTELSGGQQQRVAIARALVTNPSVLFADEPTGNLDSRVSEEIMALLQELNDESGLTIMMVTHESDIAQCAKRIIRIGDGRVIADDPVTNRRRAHHQSAATLLEAVAPAAAITPGRCPLSLADSFRVALDALTAHFLRTALATLGLVIGVGAVITLLAVGRGSQDDVQRNIRSLGTNLLTIRPGASQQGVVRTAQGSRPTLTYEDALAIAAPGSVEFVTAVSVEQNAPVQIVVPGAGNLATQAIGTDASYPLVRSAPLASGVFFDEDQLQANALVVVLGSNIAKTLFGTDDPVGQTIRINQGRAGSVFTVVGVMTSRGGTALGNLDDRVLLPITTMTKVLIRFRAPTGTFVSTINVQTATPELMGPAAVSIGALLRDRHKVTDDDFIVQSQQDALDAASGVARTQSFLLGSIAGISLVVGGIGIMNTMLVSVTERTREIGIRRAVGARRRDILMQFLTEAVLVCCLGGLLGAGAGVGLSLLVDGREVLGQTMHARLTMDAVVLSLVVSIGIGVFFGFYPASRAARLRPIEALRYE